MSCAFYCSSIVTLTPSLLMVVRAWHSEAIQWQIGCFCHNVTRERICTKPNDQSGGGETLHSEREQDSTELIMSFVQSTVKVIKETLFLTTLVCSLVLDLFTVN